jgi:hypothetical protein
MAIGDEEEATGERTPLTVRRIISVGRGQLDIDLTLTRTLDTFECDGGETGTGRAWAELERTSG